MPKCSYRDAGSIPWVGKIPQRRKWQPTSVFLPGESRGQRNLVESTGSLRVRHNWGTNNEHFLLGFFGMPQGWEEKSPEALKCICNLGLWIPWHFSPAGTLGEHRNSFVGTWVGRIETEEPQNMSVVLRQMKEQQVVFPCISPRTFVQLSLKDRSWRSLKLHFWREVHSDKVH